MEKITKAQLKKAFRAKLEAGWKSFMANLDKRPQSYLIKHARKIAAVQACYDALKKPLAGEDEMRYLILFQKIAA